MDYAEVTKIKIMVNLQCGGLLSQMCKHACEQAVTKKLIKCGLGTEEKTECLIIYE